MEATLSAPLESDGEASTYEGTEYRLICELAYKTQIPVETLIAYGVTADPYAAVPRSIQDLEPHLPPRLPAVALPLIPLDGDAEPAWTSRAADEWRTQGGKSVKWHSTGSDISNLHRVIAPGGQPTWERPIVIVEGLTDTLVAYEATCRHNINADIVGAPGAGRAKATAAEAGRRGVNCYVLLDNDTPGHKATAKAIDGYYGTAQHGNPVIADVGQQLPTGCDLTDVGPDALPQLLADAKLAIPSQDRRCPGRWGLECGRLLGKGDEWCEMCQPIDSGNGTRECLAPDCDNIPEDGGGFCSVECTRVAADPDETWRARQTKNTKARTSAIDRVADDGRVMFLQGRIWEHDSIGGWLPLSEHVTRARLASELANDLGVEAQSVTPRLTGDTMQAFKDSCQPPAASLIERMTSNEAADIKTGTPVAGTPWLDVMLRVTDIGDVQLLRRDTDIWCPRPPIPAEWGDGTYATPDTTLAWLRRATTQTDADTDSPEAHHRAAWLMSCIGHVLCERPEDEAMWVLTGAGRRGKGTFLRLVKAVTGGSSHEVTSPSELADRFAMSHLETARVLAITDAPKVDLKDRDTAKGVGRIKAIAGGDQVRSERKNGDARSVRLRCIVLVASNDVPAWATSAGDLDAWIGRMRVTDWCGPMPSPKERIPEFWRHLVAADGLENIARCAVDCYRAVLRRELPEPAEWAELRKTILVSAIDPLERWASECLTRSATTFTPTADLAESCRRWAEHHDIAIIDEAGGGLVSVRSVGKAVRAKFPVLRSERKRTHKGGPKVHGWRVAIVWEPPPDASSDSDEPEGQNPETGPFGAVSLFQPYNSPLARSKGSGIGTNGPNGPKPPPAEQADPQGLTAAAREMMNLRSGCRISDTAETPLPEHPTPADTIHGPDARLF